MLHGRVTIAELEAILVGQGIEATNVAPKLVDAGEIVWRPTRVFTDDLGIHHRFYRQVLRPSPGLAAALGNVYGVEGVELSGSDLGVHFADLALRAAFGTQFTDAVVGTPTVVTAEVAFQLSQDALRSWPGFSASDWLGWEPELFLARLSQTKLVLVPDGDGRGFRFVWQVPTADADGIPYMADLDAHTGALRRVVSQIDGGNCTPTTHTNATAVGVTESGCTATRNLWATLANDRLPDFGHEGGRGGDGSTIPNIEMYYGLDLNYPLACPTKKYGVLPIATVAGTPTYDDYTVLVHDIPGQAGADGLWFAYQTMYTLKSSLGRYSWDGSGGNARVVVNAKTTVDWAGWVYGITNLAPLNTVITTPRSVRPYTYAACLDAIAHEFGHGVVQTSANFYDPSDMTIPNQLKEGFADFLGYATEWYRQPAGSGCEQAEWKMGEDNGTALRRVDIDDGAAEDQAHPNMTFHKDDDSWNTDAHFRGNMLGVTYRLLKDGGTNPVCSRLPGLSGCNVSVSAQALTKASRILFRVLTVYASSSTQWSDLPNMAVVAAFDLYSRCTTCFNAASTQQAASDAFTAIGYTGPGVSETCPGCP